MLTWFKKVFTSLHNQTDENTDDIWLSSFGYKINWYMIPVQELTSRRLTTKNIAYYLGLYRQQEMSWNEGLAFSYAFNEGNAVYISADFNGWVYIVNMAQSPLNLLDGFIHNYYAFGNHRVGDYIGWKKVQNNEVVREFIMIGSQVVQNIGMPTYEEATLNFIDLTNLNTRQANEKIDIEDCDDKDIVKWLTEDDVIDMCQAWTGVRPTQFSHNTISSQHIPNLGIGGFLV